MHIIERFIMGKTGNTELCEDSIVITEHFIAVIDGVTNKSSFSFQSQTPGRIAGTLIKEAIEALDPGITAWDAEKAINRRIYSWYEEHNILDQMRNKPEIRCTASAVLYSKVRGELWFVGDCQVLLNGFLYQPQKNTDKILGELRAMIIYTELSQGKTEAELLKYDSSREKILDLLKIQMKLQNVTPENEFSYYVFDGFTCNAPNRLRIVPVDRDHGEIILASDGYPRIFSTLLETEEYLAQVLREDPLCYKLHRTTKGCYANNLSFDDRAYIRFIY
jgi:glycerophosphoryl diester phosphodiesterase